MTSKEVAADILRRCYVDHRKEPKTVFKGLGVEIEEAIDAAVWDERQACVATIKGVIENVEFAERERIKADVKVLDDLLYKVTEALIEMAKMYGGKHEKDCPQDDTCDCHYAASNKMVNDAAKAARDHFHETGRKGPSQP